MYMKGLSKVVQNAYSHVGKKFSNYIYVQKFEWGQKKQITDSDGCQQVSPDFEEWHVS